MHVCPQCGKVNENGAHFCTQCGMAFPAGPNPGPAYMVAPHPSDEGGFLWGLLGFVVPIVGLVLYLVWKQEYPKRSRAMGIGALVSTVCGVAFLFLFLFLWVFLFGFAMTQAF